jgi:hypothetical protein
LSSPTSNKTERTLRRLLRILDLTRDLERHQADLDFARGGGEIIYIFDENIFEMLIRPWKHTEAVETFYGDLWATDADEEKTSAWHLIEAQSAVLASEVLVNGQLPGRRSHALYMTDPHRYECARRIETLAEQYSKKVKEGGVRVGELTGKLARLADLSQIDEDKPTRRASPIDRKTLGLEADLEALRSSGADTRNLTRFRVTRLAVEGVASDKVLEPLQQLHRLTQADYRNRFENLNDAFSVPENQVAILEDKAKRWFKLLLNELARPRNKASRRRENRALWNDARSLAYVRWAAEQAHRREQRLVLVTGDRILFDAYRRWYAGLRPGFDGYFDPFVLRRATQYSPIFTLTRSDAGTGELTADNGPSSDVLGLFHEGLEATLLALTFAKLAKSEGASADVAVARTRERTALKLVDQPSLVADPELEELVSSIGPEWLDEHEAKIRSIRIRFQAVQRASLAGASQVIAARLTNDELSVARRLVESDGQDAGLILQKYVSTLLDDIIKDSIQLWLPIAASFITSRKAPGSEERLRVPMTINLKLPDHSTLASVIDAWWSGGRGDRRRNAIFAPVGLDEFAERSDLVFAVAAGLALAMQEANEAERFAGLAVRSAGIERSEGRLPDPTAEAELSMLHALTLRFQMAAVGAETDAAAAAAGNPSYVDRLDQIKTFYDRAEQALASHRTMLEGVRDDRTEDERLLLDIRVESESAALHLFMATALLLASQERTNLEHHTQLSLTDRGIASIRRCFSLEAKLAKQDHDWLRRLRRQYIPNVAAAEVLRYFVMPPGQYAFNDSLRAYIRPLKALMAELPNTPPLLRAEFLAFQCLADRRPDHADQEFTALARQNARLRLPMDLWMFTKILEEFG